MNQEDDPGQEGELFRLSDIDWTAHYRAIGEFIAEYEKISVYLRFTYGCLMQSCGLREWRLSHFILHIEAISPHHLTICLHAAIKHILPDRPDLISLADNVHKEVVSIEKKRNEIAHGEWHIGPEAVIISSESRIPQNMGFKRKITKDGEKVENLPTLDEFSSLIGRVRIVVADIKRLMAELTTALFKKEGGG